MRVGSLPSAGPLARLLLPLLVLVLVLPAAARAQGPAAVTFGPAPGGVRPSTEETVAFKAAGAERFECSIDGATPSGCESPAPVPALGNGPHFFAVRGLDAGGDLVAEGRVDWVVDAVAPEVSFTGGPEGTSAAGPAAVTFAGGADTVRLECSVDGGAFETCESPREVTVVAGVTQELRVRAVDAVGNVGPAVTRSWTGAVPVPVGPAEITAGPTGVSSSRTPAFSFTAPGAADFECAVDAGAFASCASGTALPALADGEHRFRVRGVDSGGAPGPEAERVWTVDATPPVVTFTQRPDPVEGTLETAITFTVSDPAATVTCALDGAPVACTPGTSLPLTVTGARRHTFLVRATDAAGNVSTQPALTWEVDLEGPAVAITAAPVSPTKDAAVRFTLTPSEPVSAYDCRLTGPGRADATWEACTATPRYDGLAEGDHVFSARVFDGAGNPSAEASHPFTVDRTAPVLTFSAVPPDATSAATATVAFTAQEPLASVACTLDGTAVAPCDGGATVPNAALALGEHIFRVTASDAATNETVREIRWTTSFDAAFDWDTAAAVIERPLPFTSRSAGDLREQAWDLDGDGAYDDATGPSAAWTFAEPGVHTVGIQVTHRDGATQASRREVTVGRTPLIVDPPVVPPVDGRRAPVASFTAGPQPAAAGQVVTLTSTSSDPDGTIASWAWDLDGDGAFDDASGPTASRTFPAGTSIVGLRVVDADGLSATSFASVEVAAAPGPVKPPVTTTPKTPAMLKPFPVIRIAGTAVGSRIRLRIFAVKAPGGTSVEVRCAGRGCPFKIDRHRVTGRGRTVRIRKLEAAPLRAGIVIEVRVHAPGKIGKYTRLVMRSGAAPKRTDACVSGTRLAKVACTS